MKILTHVAQYSKNYKVRNFGILYSPQGILFQQIMVPFQLETGLLFGTVDLL